MIYEKDLDEAIAECQGVRNPDASTCMKLAAFYTIKQYMFGRDTQNYSYAPAPVADQIEIDGDSEFAQTVRGKPQSEVMPVIDELMQTLAVVQPKVYSAVLKKLY